MPKAKPKAKATSGEQQTADDELELFDAGGFAFGGAKCFEDKTGDSEVVATTPKKPKAKAKANKVSPASPPAASPGEARPKKKGAPTKR